MIFILRVGFEGEKYVEVRGIKLFESIAKSWMTEDGNEIPMKVEKSEEELKLLFI